MKPLSGWKEIAKHLNQGVRTVQRWEDFGLRVHRIGPHHGGQVVAFVEEVEAWERSAPLRYRNRVKELTAEVKLLQNEVSLIKTQIDGRNHAIRKSRSRGRSKAA